MSTGENVIPFKRDGEDRSARTPSPPSQARRAGPTSNSISPGSAASSGDQEGAGVSSASAPSFVQVGEPAFAVVMRLQSKFPRIQVRTATEGEMPPSS